MMKLKILAAVGLVALGAFTGRAAVYVAPDGTGDGSSWGAASSITAAFAAGGTDEIRLAAGEYTLSAGLTLSSARKVTGGWNGESQTGISTLVAAQGATLENILSVTAASGEVTLAKLGFRGSPVRGLFFDGGANVTVENCVFEKNGGSVFGRGRGAAFNGTGSNTATIKGCRFEDNCERRYVLDDDPLTSIRSVPSIVLGDALTAEAQRQNEEKNRQLTLQYDMRGLALYCSNIKVTLTDTVFDRNGVYRTPQKVQSSGMMAKAVAAYIMNQSVVCFEDAPVTASGNTFHGNVITGFGMAGGKIVYVGGQSGGSSFANCTWTANDMQMDTQSIYQRSSGSTQIPISVRLSANIDTGSAVVDVTSGDVSFTGCTFAYNLTGSGWTAGLNVKNGHADVSGSLFWGNVINETWGQRADLFVGLNGTAALEDSTFAALNDKFLPVDDVQVTLGEGMKYGDPHFATTPATFIDRFVTLDSRFNTLTAETFPFIRPTMMKLENDTGAGRCNELQVWLANGLLTNERSPQSAELGKIAPLDELDITHSTVDGVYKTPTTALTVGSVDVTFPLDLKPKFVVKTGAGDNADVTICYSTAAPADANSPASYAYTKVMGSFGPAQEMLWCGPKGVAAEGEAIYWLVEAKNAKGTQTKTGTIAARGPLPTVWSEKEVNIHPQPVMAYATQRHPATWNLHYQWEGQSHWRGSSSVRRTTDASGITTGRAAEWFRHADDPKWGRYGDVSGGIVPDWFALVRPADGDHEQRGLVVLVHGRGSGYMGFSSIPGSGMSGTNSCYGVRDDMYAIALDCRENCLNDFWWGAMPPATTSLGLSNASSYYNFMFGAMLMGDLNAGPTLNSFWHDAEHGPGSYSHTMTCLEWCHRDADGDGHIDDTPTMKRVMDTIEWAVRKFKIDRNRIYIAGNSMGGQAALAIGLKHGEVFAAINGNVPATVVYPASQIGFIDVQGKDVAYDKFKMDYVDPPVCVDISGSDDCWSRDHDIMYRNMNRFKFSYTGWWQPLGHQGGYDPTRAVNAHAMSFDYFNIVKNRCYPVFSNASGNSNLPWPQQSWKEADPTSKMEGGVESDSGKLEAAQNADLIGQWNSYFRWEIVSDTPEKLEMDIWIAGPHEIAIKGDDPVYTRPTALAVDVSPRRLQQFPKSLKTGYWTFGANQSGNLAWDDTVRCYTAERLTVTQAKKRLTFYASGAAAAPTASAVPAADTATDALKFSVTVSSLGTGAGSVKLTARYGTSPDALTSSKVLAASAGTGTATYTIDGLQGPGKTYFVQIDVENNLGKKTTLDCGEAMTYCAHTRRVPSGEAKASTCDETGLTGGEKCADCGFEFERQKPTPWLGHDLVFDHWEQLVTDVTDGIKVMNCSRCAYTSNVVVKAGTDVPGEVSADKKVSPPVLAARTWTGKLIVPNVPTCAGYTVTKNEGGTASGSYPIELTLASGCTWVDGFAQATRTITFDIVKPANTWLTEPMISNTSWNSGSKKAGVITWGVPQYGNESMVVTLNGQPFAEGDAMPTEPAAYTLVFFVPEGESVRSLTKTLTFTVKPASVPGPLAPWVRFTYMRKHAPAEGGPGLDISVVGLGQIGIYDVDDNCLNLDLTAGTSAAALTAGQYFYDYGSAKPNANEIASAANVFKSAKNTWTANQATQLVNGNPDYYQVFTMRLDDDARPSKYNLRVGDTAKLVTGRFPVDWKVETSVDGETWTVVSTVTDAEVPTVDFTWYENGGSETEPKTFIDFDTDEPPPPPPAGSVAVPTFAAKTYTGVALGPDVPDGAKYVIVGAMTFGPDAGTYNVTVALADKKETVWVDTKTTEDRTVPFVISPAANSWTVEPGIDPASWTVGETAGTLTAGVAAHGEVSVTLNGQPFDGILPEAAGSYTLVYSVPAGNYAALSKEVKFTIRAQGTVGGAWVRFTIRQRHASVNELFDGDFMALGRFAVYSEESQCLNLGLKAGSSLEALGVDEYWYEWGKVNAKPGNIATAANLFKADTSKWQMQGGTGNLFSDNPDYYQVFTMRLAEDASPVKYNLATADNSANLIGRYPISWKVETCADGKTWAVVSEISDETVPTSSYAWYNNGGLAMNNGTPSEPTAFYEFTAITPTPGKKTNSWTTEAKLSKPSWKVGEEAATVTDAVALYGEVVKTLNGEAFTAMPTAEGTYTLAWTVEETDEYTGLSVEKSFTISPAAQPVQAENEWITTPSISPTSWKEGASAGTVTPGVAKYGADTMTVTLDGADWDGTALPTTVGEHKIVYAVPETDEWTELSAEVKFTIKSQGTPVSATPWVRFTYMRKHEPVSGTLWLDQSVVGLGQIAIYDVDGNCLNLGLKAGSSAAALTAGQYFYDYGSAKPKDSEIISAANVFSSSKNTWTVNTVTSLVSGDPAYYQVFTMRLDDDAHPSKYNLRVGDTAKTVTGRFPVDWKIETSADGEAWTVVSTVTDAVVPTVDFAWYKDGGSDTQPTAFYEFESSTPEPPAGDEFPKINGVDAKSEEAFLAAATSASKITVPADWTVAGNALKNAKGETFATFAAYYDVSLIEGQVKIELNAKALPELAEPSDLQEAESVFAVSETGVGLFVKATDPHLWYGLAYAAKLGGEFVPPGKLVQGEAGKTLCLEAAKDASLSRFYKIYVTDVAP